MLVIILPWGFNYLIRTCQNKGNFYNQPFAAICPFWSQPSRGANIRLRGANLGSTTVLQICELERKIEISFYWFMLLLYVYFLNICFARFMVMLRGVTHLDHEKGFGIYVFHNIFSISNPNKPWGKSYAIEQFWLMEASLLIKSLKICWNFFFTKFFG